MRVCEGVGLLGLLAQFYSVGVLWAGPVCILGRLILKYLSLSVVRVFRVPWLETRNSVRVFSGSGFSGTGSGFSGSDFGFRVIRPPIVIVWY